MHVCSYVIHRVLKTRRHASVHLFNQIIFFLNLIQQNRVKSYLKLILHKKKIKKYSNNLIKYIKAMFYFG